MTIRHKLLAVVAGVLVLLLIRIGEDLYRWYSFDAEREAIVRLQTDLESTALEVVNSHIAADSLLEVLKNADAQLAVFRGRLPGQNTQGATISLSDYNQHVADRNRLLRRWRSSVLANHATTDRYNLLADSIRGFAQVMGEAFYPIRSPAEIVADRGRGDVRVTQSEADRVD